MSPDASSTRRASRWATPSSSCGKPTRSAATFTPPTTDASGPLDPNFQGYGRLRADADGRYRIKTIKPPPYSGRTPHIHFNVASGGTTLTTQMFFEGEPLNERDFLYRYLGRDDRRASTGRPVDRTPAMEPDAVAVTWDIVLKV